jgi:acetoin utilization deacetylase AcuC-like enzyme
VARGRHHGGDQHDVLYLSTHQHPFYPGTGSPVSYEPGGACGVVNVGLQEGDGGDAFRAAVESKFVPFSRARTLCTFCARRKACFC